MVDKQQKLIVVGLDGGTYDIITSLWKEGKLPHLKKISEKGYSGLMKSTYPPVTSPAWPSMITGANPGKHGLYGFRKIEPDGNFRPFSSRDLKKRSFFEILSKNGFKIISINVPMTYPPKRINGIMIGGFGTPGEDTDFVHPKELKEEIIEKDYSIMGFNPRELVYSDENAKKIFDLVYENTKRRHKIAKDLLKKNDFDLFMIVYSATDTLSHFMCKFYDKTHILHEPSMSTFGKKFEKIYELVDNHIGDLMKTYPDAKIIIVSDHGSGKIKRNLHLNTFFKEKGLLTLKKKEQKTSSKLFRKKGFTGAKLLGILNKFHLGWVRKLVPSKIKQQVPWDSDMQFSDIDFSKTKCFTIGEMGLVYLIRENYFEVGSVKDDEKETSKIIRELKKLEFHGEKVVSKVHRKEDIFKGEDLTELPDLYVETTGLRYNILPGIKTETFSIPDSVNGNHRQNGIFFYLDPKGSTKVSKENITIYDIFPTILEIFDIPIPTYADGDALVKTNSKPKKEKGKISTAVLGLGRKI